MLLVIAAIALTPAAGQAQTGAARPLAGRTEIQGSQSGEQVVELTKPATFRVTSGLDSPDFAVRGTGRTFGIALEPAAGGVPLLTAVRVQSCFVRACRSPDSYDFVTVDPGLRIASTSPTATTYALPVGRYRLRLLTDGAPVDATLLLTGPTGRTLLRPPAGRPFRIDSLAPTPVLGSPGVAVASAVVGHDLTGRGLDAVVLGRVDTVASVAGTVAGCFYAGDVPVVLPNCAGGDGVKFTGGLVAASRTAQILYGSYADLTASGRFTGGMSVADASVADAIRLNIAWIDA